jgi:hypothetical protein
MTVEKGPSLAQSVWAEDGELYSMWKTGFPVAVKLSYWF